MVNEDERIFWRKRDIDPILRVLYPYRNVSSVGEWLDFMGPDFSRRIRQGNLTGAPPIIIAAFRYQARRFLIEETKIIQSDKVMARLSNDFQGGFTVLDMVTEEADEGRTINYVLPLQSHSSRTAIELIYNPVWGLGWRIKNSDLINDYPQLAKDLNRSFGNKKTASIFGKRCIAADILAGKTTHFLYTLKADIESELNQKLTVDVKHLPEEIHHYLELLSRQNLLIGNCRTYYQSASNSTYDTLLMMTPDEKAGVHFSLERKSGLKLAGMIGSIGKDERISTSLPHIGGQLYLITHSFYPPDKY